MNFCLRVTGNADRYCCSYKYDSEALTSADFLLRTAVSYFYSVLAFVLYEYRYWFITKSAPQLNLFSFGFPMTILGTFFVLYFSVDAMQFVFSELLDNALGIIRVVLNGVDYGGK